MRSILDDLKDLHFKYLGTKTPTKVFNGSYDSVVSEDADFIYLTALREISEQEHIEEAKPLIDSLYSYFEGVAIDSLVCEAPEDFEAEIGFDSGESNDSEVPEDSLEDSEGSEEELGSNEETFADKYPDVDEEVVVKELYDNWLNEIKSKPFFKTIFDAYELYKAESLNFLDRKFLWRFIKAISSCLTHLLIEGEQDDKALALIDRYYDSLIACLNSVIHASDKEDVVNSFQFMVDFLGISKETTQDKNL